MAMDSTETAAALLDFANYQCKQSWTSENAPAGVNLFIEKAQEFLANTQGLESRRLGDASWAYSTKWPEPIISLLNPYRKVRFV